MNSNKAHKLIGTRLITTLLLGFISVLSYGATCTETASASGQDDAATTATISSITCNGGNAITAVTLDATIGGNCISWYSYDIIVNGTTIATQQCNQTGYDLTAYLPITSVSIVSNDEDAWSDFVTLNLTLNVTYNSGPMAYGSSTCTQDLTSDVAPGSTDQEIIGLEVVTTGSSSPLNLTQLLLNMTGTTSTSDVSNITVYYTGTSNTFGTTTTFGTGTPGAGTITITGTQTLAEGTNYFWIAYDIAASPTLGNVVDAQCTQITVGGSNYTPSTSNPIGNRTIAINYCSSNATSTGDSEVDQVVLNGTTTNINNNTASVCATYSDFTSLTPADLTQALSYQVGVTIGTCNGDYTKYARVFIDWNQDGDFDDANEDLGEQGGISTTTTYNFSFTVPAGASTGNTRMRVICKEGSGITSCGTYSYGETEDYTITVVASGPMSYSSSTTTQASVADVPKCSGNQEIIKIEVVTTGSTSPLDLTQLRIRTDGCSNPLGDIANIEVYYTGNINVFSTSSLFASAAPQATGTNILINGSQTLNPGSNYFWVVYDMSAGATASNTLDGLCNRITVDGSNYVPSTTSPAGSRTIVSCVTSPGGVSNNLTAWFNASNGPDNTTNGGMISSWSNNAGNANVPTVTQATNAMKPVYRTDRINWNPIVEFDGADDYLYQASTLGSDLFDPSENTVFMMHIARSGVVYFKWEHTTNNTDRIGFEMSAGKPRFDFPSSDADDQTVANSSYSTQGEIVTGHTSSNVSTIRMNGATDATNNTSGTMGTGLTREFVIGNNPTSNPLPCEIDYAELAIYKTSLSNSEMNQVESYMAIKYGVTLGTNGTSMDYNSPYGTTIWDQSSNGGYAFDIAGIGRSDASDLQQPKSASINSPGDIVIVANGNSISSPTAIGSDESYFVWGHNNLAVSSNSVTDFGTTVNGEVVEARISRVWKAQETGTLGTITLQFDVSGAPGVNDLANARLLVDADGVFATGAYSISPSSYNNTTQIIEFQYDFDGTYGFHFTIGSLDNTNTPLPVVLKEIDSKCNTSSTILEWTTTSESNTKLFSIEKSTDGVNFELSGEIEASGNSSAEVQYQWIDSEVTNSPTYYRISCENLNGEKTLYPVHVSNCMTPSGAIIYPNPFDDEFSVQLDQNSEGIEILIYDALGRSVPILRQQHGNIIHIELLSAAAPGIYTLVIKEGGSYTQHKLVKRQ